MDKTIFVNNLLSILKYNNPVMCGQEHFIQSGHRKKKHLIQKVSDAFPGFKCFATPAVKISEEVKGGRPQGGLWICWPEELDQYVRRVKSNHWRVQCVLFILPEARLLLINVYHPTDPKTVNERDFDDRELNEVFSAIDKLRETTAHDELLLCGDRNADFSRYTAFVNKVKTFDSERNLEYSWDTFKIDYTHIHTDDKSTAILDHFVWTKGMKNHVTNGGVLHISDNTSRHSPVWIKVEVSGLDRRKEEAVITEKVSWNKSTEEMKKNFSSDVDQSIKSIDIPYEALTCENIRCQLEDHKEDLEELTELLIKAVDESAKTNLAWTVGSRNKLKRVVPGWDELVKPFKEKSDFWNWIWRDSGKPLNCELHNLMKRSRAQYHFAIRRCKNAATEIRNDKLIEAVISGDTDLFDVIKKYRKSKKEVATVVDENVGSKSIADHFGNQYKNLYNQQNSRTDMVELLEDLNGSIENHEINYANNITSKLIKEIIEDKIKPKKADVQHDFNSDCLKNCPEVFYKLLSDLFRALAIHGFVPAVLLLCAIVPLVKDPSGSLDDSSNYRGIAISSLFLKVWDWLIIMLHGDDLGSDELQFGFKKSSSCSLCTWSVVETINYYKRGGSEVFACLLDCQKAFDTVEHKRIFQKLSQRIPVIFVRIMLVIYIGQKCFVRWNFSESEFFSVQNGVRQGAVLSPLLFSLYVNELIQKLRETGMGCWVGSSFMGIIAYADDLIILAPRRDALQKMIRISDMFMREHRILFSTKKTKCMYFPNKNSDHKDTIEPIEIAGKKSPWVATAVHVGNTLHEDGTMDQDIKVKRAQFISDVQNVQQEFYKSHPEVQSKLTSLYCSSCYGSNTWDLFSPWARKYFISWNVNLRIIWDLPYNTHRYFFEHLTQTRHLKVLLLKRFLRFILSITAAQNSACKMVLYTCYRNMRSTTGSNIRNIELAVNERIALEDLKKAMGKLEEKMHFEQIPKEEMWRISVMKEMALMKQGFLDVEGFAVEETELILQYICSK